MIDTCMCGALAVRSHNIYPNSGCESISTRQDELPTSSELSERATVIFLHGWQASAMRLNLMMKVVALYTRACVVDIAGGYSELENGRLT